jgi:hypothetical protein
MIMESPHNEYCNMLFAHGACNSQLALLHGNTRYLLLVDVIQTICSDGWSSVSVREKCNTYVTHESVPSTDTN